MKMNELLAKPFAGDGRPLADFGDGATLIERAGRLQNVAGLYVSMAHNVAITERLGSVNINFHEQDGLAMTEELPRHGLFTKNILRWLTNEPLQAVQNFIRFTDGRYEGHAASFARRAPVIRSKVASHLKGLQDRYEAAPIVLSASADVLRRVGLTALNSFEAGRHDIEGQCRLRPGVAEAVDVANLFDAPAVWRGVGERLTMVAAHESLHGAFATIDAGFYHGILGDDPSPMLEDIGVEHQTRCGSAGFDTLDPHDRTDAGGSYENELILFAGLAQYGKYPISAALLANAQASPRSSTRRTSPRYELMRRLQSNSAELLPAYKEGGFTALSKKYDSLAGADRETFLEIQNMALRHRTTEILSV